MNRGMTLLTGLILGLTAAANSSRGALPARPTVLFTDGAGRPLQAQEVGSTVYVAVKGLEPNRHYEFRMEIDGKTASFARLGADGKGEIRPFALWYETGIAGCSPRVQPDSKLPPFTFRTFDDADAALQNKTLTVTVHAIEDDPSGKLSPMKLHVGKALSSQEVPVVKRKSPMLYASDARGCLRNSQRLGEGPMYVSGLNFQPGEEIDISVVPNQREWRVGDAIRDVTGPHAGSASKPVTVDDAGRFTVKAWDPEQQRRGVYDLVAHRKQNEPTASPQIGPRDIISYALEAGFILCTQDLAAGPTIDIAGRPLSKFPYFQFAHSFALNETVWACLDPTYVPEGHPGARYAAYYVVKHQGVDGWNPAKGPVHLTDVSGGVEIVPIKAGSLGGAEVPIWNPPSDKPLPAGSYDVVVDFGTNPGEASAVFAPDDEYNPAVDFLDGADQKGFVVLEDPYELGAIPIGEASYSRDDFFPVLGDAYKVDLRAVVRYPAKAAGENQAVAEGKHPIFIIEHGNHESCRDGSADHAHCKHRVPNHMGYMHLLDILASHGIIAVSIDAYDLTGAVPGWIPERGELILKHLELWSHMNDKDTFPTYPDFFEGRFRDHVDLSRISVSGHSRGGEASVAAYMLNTDPNFIINSVSSIAPVDFEEYNLPDVPYFVILPAADGDVSDMSGLRIYDRAGRNTSPSDSTDKSGIYVYGANHNFFNTVWADDNDDSWAAREEYIEKADQQKIGEAYVSAFTRIHLNGESVYEDMLRGRLTFPSTAGYKIYHMHHDRDSLKLENGSGSAAVVNDATKVVEAPPAVSVHAAPALRIDWSKPDADLTYTVPQDHRDLTKYGFLSFRVAQTLAPANPKNGGQDFVVEMKAGGKTQATYTSRFDAIPQPYHRRGKSYSVMTTVRIPLSSFAMNKSGFPLDHVDSVRFRFSGPSEGEIYVDDIEFSR